MNLVRGCVLDLKQDEVISCAAFHPTRAIIAVAIDCTIKIYSLHTNELIGKLTTDKPVISLVLSQSSIVARLSGDICVWGLYTLELIGILYYGEEKSILEMELTPNSTFLCCSRVGSKTVIVHDISPAGFKKPSQKLDCKKPATGISVHPKEPLLAVYCEGTIRIWDLRTGSQVSQCDDLLKQKEYLGAKGSSSLRGFISFSGSGDTVVVCNERKQLYSLSFEDNSLEYESGFVPSNNNGTVLSIVHHPRYSFFWVLLSTGRLESYDSIKCTSTGFVVDESVSELDAVEQFCCSKTPNSKEWVLASDLPLSLQIHPTLNYLTFAFNRGTPRTHFIIYSLFHPDHRFASLPSICEIPLSPQSYIKPESSSVKEDFYYVSSKGYIIQYDTRNVSSVIAKDISFMLETTGIMPYHLIYSERKAQFIMFFQKIDITGNLEEKTFSVFSTKENSPVKLTPGRDAFFTEYAKDINVVSLSTSKTELTVSGTKYQLQSPVYRIFTSPCCEGLSCLFVTNQYLVYSSNAESSYKGKTPYDFDYTKKIKLKRWEVVDSVLWNIPPGNPENVPIEDCLVAILTSHRIIIADYNLNIITYIESPSNLQTIYFNSIRWVGMSLLYIVDSQVRYLTLNGTHRLLCELDNAESVFVYVWNDRIVTAAWASSEVKVTVNGVGLLEPLILGELAAAGRFGRPQKLSFEMLQFVLRSYDYKRIDLTLIETLHSEGYHDVALQLSLPNSSCSLPMKFREALHCKKFKTSMEILDDYCRKHQLPTPLTGDAKLMAENLASNAQKYGQYHIAFKCYELLHDFNMLLQLSIIHKDLDGINTLKKKIQADSKYSHLLVACNKQIDILSSGAPQSPILDFDFTNISKSYDTTPIVIPDMQGNPKLNICHITPWAFLDTIQKWFPRQLDSTQNLGPSYSEPPPEPQTVSFPSETKDIISSLVLRIKGITNDINASEKAIQHPSTTLEPPPIRKISLVRDGYSISSSSILQKNVKPISRNSETSAISLSESLMSESEEDDSSYSKPALDDSSAPSEGEKNEPEEDVDVKEGTVEETASEDTITEDTPAEERNPRFALPPTLPSASVIFPISYDDLKPYPCSQIVRLSHTGNLKRKVDLGSLANIKLPVNEFFSAFDSITSALRMLETGMFSSALCHIDKSIDMLINGKTPLEHKRKEIKICVYYKLAIRLLVILNLLDHSGDDQKIAYLTRILASIPLRQVHRVAAIAVAADKNLQTKNYGAAAKFLEVLKQKNVLAESNIDESLAECEKEQFINSVGYISPDRPFCCFSSFKEISKGSVYLYCDFCDAVYMTEVKQVKETCCFCMYGILHSTRA